MKTFQSILSLLLLSVIGCTSNNKKNMESLHSMSRCVGTSNYKLCVESQFYKDSTQLDTTQYSSFRYFNPICVKQTLVFYDKDKVIKTSVFQCNKTTQTNSRGHKIQMNSIQLTRFTIISSPFGAFYCLYGYGGCNNCEEYVGLFSLNGEDM